MQHPQNFMTIATLSFVTFGIIQFAFALVSYMAFGQSMLSPVIDNGFSQAENSAMELEVEADRKIF